MTVPLSQPFELMNSENYDANIFIWIFEWKYKDVPNDRHKSRKTYYYQHSSKFRQCRLKCLLRGSWVWLFLPTWTLENYELRRQYNFDKKKTFLIIQIILILLYLNFFSHCTKNEVYHFFSKCDQIRSFLRIWSHLLKKSLNENFIFYVVSVLFVINFMWLYQYWLRTAAIYICSILFISFFLFLWKKFLCSNSLH